MLLKNLIILFLSLLILSCSKQTAKYDLGISNVNLIDGTGSPIQEGVSVYINKGKIVEINTLTTHQIENVIDGTGKYLIPGLFDCHVHTTSFQEDFPKLIHYGVTSVFVPGGSTCTNDYYATLRSIGNQDSIPAPRVFHTSQHFTMEGRHPVKTYASSNWKEGETVFFLKDTAQIAEIVKEVAKYPILGIKLTIEDGPAPPFVERMPQDFINKTVSEAAKYGLEVFAHVSDNEEFLMAVKGGAQNIVHFVGIEIDWENDEHISAINKLLDREGSIVTTLMIDKSFIYPLNPEWLKTPSIIEAYPAVELKKLLTPQAIGRAQKMAALTKLEYGLDEISMESLFLSKVEDIQRLLDLGMNITLGTDAGNSFNFHGYSLHEEMQILEMGGIAPRDIIKMGTLNAARMMHVQDSLGSIEPGKLADLILLNANPLASISNCLDINTVIKNGVIQKRIDK
ncbi:imidazolonepropionase-like amidohydrolase [Ulvibacter sp. MAR_2010_11]|nr:imidazolonepropionase-like amidohydrolase [Ulvibacter sp. MAR_2010_11]